MSLVFLAVYYLSRVHAATLATKPAVELTPVHFAVVDGDRTETMEGFYLGSLKRVRMGRTTYKLLIRVSEEEEAKYYEVEIPREDYDAYFLLDTKLLDVQSFTVKATGSDGKYRMTQSFVTIGRSGETTDFRTSDLSTIKSCQLHRLKLTKG